MSKKQWYEVSISFKATEKKANKIWDKITLTVCEGKGKGKKHKCKRSFASGMKDIKE